MTISGTSLDGASELAVRVQKLTQDEAKREGAQAVSLIEEASAPPVGVQGEGRHVNTYG
jgi:hypothetical protein